MILGIPHILNSEGYWAADKDSEQYKRYKKGVEHQLEQWLAGNPVHNNWDNDPNNSECCPDFSCCNKQLMWSEKMRKAYVEHPELRDEMGATALFEMLQQNGSLDGVEILGLTKNNQAIN
jgi:hypothetical protein